LEHAVLIVHALIAIVIVGLILIQQGKGADAGASFGGGSSQTVLGQAGGGNLLTRWTSILVTLFFLSSLTLAYFAKQNSLKVDGVFEDSLLMEQINKLDNAEVPALPTVNQAPVTDDIPSE
jgi:preprotein translocase subunit SecG